MFGSWSPRSSKVSNRRKPRGRNKPHNALSCHHRRLLCEPLEDRRLLSIAVGDYVRVNAVANVRTGPGTGYGLITSPNYPGQAPVGSVGIVTAGPTTANGYTWWDVNYGNGTYTGWSIQDNLENAVTSGRVAGIDVSSYQGSVNWTSVASGGHSFAFARATQGNDPSYDDPTFVTNMTSGRAAGLLMGAYHFAYANLNPALTGAGSADSEATNFVNFAGPYITGGYLRPVLDVESIGCGNLTGTALSAWVSEWMQKVTALTGVRPVIYTNSNFAASYLSSSLTNYSIWIAAWYSTLSATPSATPWSTWNFWQYGGGFGSSGVRGATIPGITPGQVYNGNAINGNVDVDEFNGNLSQLTSQFVIPSTSAFYIGERVQAASGGANVRDAALDSPWYAQVGGVHGTIQAEEYGSAGGFTGNWWKISWDSAPPNYQQPGWSAESVIATIPAGGDFAEPNLASSYYTTSNIFWQSGYAPGSTNPPNPQLGSALGNCTWYASGRLLELGYNAGQVDALHGNASDWASEASAAGIPVDTTLAVGSIAQSTSMDHVAVVESINGDGTITVTESSYLVNANSPWDILWHNRTCSPSWFENFIHVSKAAPPLPNLTPYQPSGWSDMIVVSNVRGTNTDSNPLYTTDNLYVDSAVINNGAAASGTFYTALYVDGAYKWQWSTSRLSSGAYVSVPDYNLGALPAGTHTLQIVADYTNLIAESNESDNSYTKTITVQMVPTATTVTSSQASSTYGDLVTFTATVAPATSSGESGTVQFQIDGSNTGAPAPVSGNTASYSTSALAATTAINHSVVAIYSGDAKFSGSTSNTLYQSVAKATPAIAWTTPAPIDFGTPLSSAQLNAAANTDGSYSYSPSLGSILHAGSQTLSVTFTPAETTNYTTATASVALNVNPATHLVVTSGVLIITAASDIADGASLTVGDPAAFFAPAAIVAAPTIVSTASAAQALTDRRGAAVSAAPRGRWGFARSILPGNWASAFAFDGPRDRKSLATAARDAVLAAYGRQM